jgi:hypothetical protein
MIKAQAAVTRPIGYRHLLPMTRDSGYKAISWEIDGGFEPGNADAMPEPINSRMATLPLSDYGRLPVILELVPVRC